MVSGNPLFEEMSKKLHQGFTEQVTYRRGIVDEERHFFLGHTESELVVYLTGFEGFSEMDLGPRLLFAVLNRSRFL